jgi:hypothetical protein
MDDLVHRSDVGANSYKLVLAKLQRNLLREIAVHRRQRSMVYFGIGWKEGFDRQFRDCDIDRRA